jgi:glucan phosphoethanolaminetransferase (alkaline phosphatase superfamily)
MLACVLAIRYSRIEAGRSWPLRIVGVSGLAAWALTAALLGIVDSYRKSPMLMIAGKAAEARFRYQQLARRADALARAPVPLRSCKLRYDRVVIVLGESAVTDHMSVFGYPRPTTPFAQASKAHAFEALSPANQTRYALAMMLTAATPDNFDVFFHSHSLISLLRSCGMHTLWVSNQGRRGRYDSFSSSIALEADESIFLNEWSWTNVTYDGQIVNELHKRHVADGRRQATFVHLIGSHVKYRERYPPGFGFPKVAGLIDEYDNSLLYTDYVLSQLVGMLYDRSTLVVYVSDHGQMVSEDKFGSGFLPGYREEFRTPLLIWTADSVSIARVKDELGGATLNLESFDNLISYLVGISPSPQLSTRDIVAVLSPSHLRQYHDLPSIRDQP